MPAAQAVEALIHDYGSLVFQVIFGLTGDWQESQDLTQETFLTAFKAIEAARQASGANFHAKAWLMQIAANTARMSLRRRSLVRFVPFASLRKEDQDERDGELVDERPAAVQPAGYGLGHVAGDPAELIAERDLVQRTMAQLPETLRLCLLLSIVGGLSSRERSIWVRRQCANDSRGPESSSSRSICGRAETSSPLRPHSARRHSHDRVDDGVGWHTGPGWRWQP